ncbi:hypothetical protein [Streptomyces sp. NBC_01176]|uniref:hypothetical protein n=1 Tax=Streptomyces sp. NBC_01176 TaxID=2903760 RepID=UPI0038666EAA|nr:hypothetical protein OG199_30495 [Streptomyces sp. NBC_01176]
MSTSDLSARPAAAQDPIDALLAAGRGRRRAGPLVASAAFGRRGPAQIRHDPKQLVDSAVVPILFTLLFTHLFGGAVSGGWLRAFVDVNPLSHVASAARDLTNDAGAGGAVVRSLAATAARTPVCAPITLRLYG